MWKSFCLPWTTSTKALPSRPCSDTPTRQQRVSVVVSRPQRPSRSPPTMSRVHRHTHHLARAAVSNTRDTCLRVGHHAAHSFACTWTHTTWAKPHRYLSVRLTRITHHIPTSLRTAATAGFSNSSTITSIFDLDTRQTTPATTLLSVIHIGPQIHFRGNLPYIWVRCINIF